MGYLGRRIGKSQTTANPQADGNTGGILDLFSGGYFQRTGNIYNAPGIAPIPPSGITATGGVISDYIDGPAVYRAHVFSSTGTFSVSAATGTGLVEYLVVAGGGGGGGGGTGGRPGGGGGAGGFRTNLTGHPLAGSPFPVSPGPYGVTIGGGGGGGAGGNAAATATKGIDSVFSSITSTGGGYGGWGQQSYSHPGGPGGSGGGAQNGDNSPPIFGGTSDPVTSPAQGNPAGGPTGGVFGGGGGGGGDDEQHEGGDDQDDDAGADGGDASAYKNICMLSRPWTSINDAKKCLNMSIHTQSNRTRARRSTSLPAFCMPANNSSRENVPL